MMLRRVFAVIASSGMVLSILSAFPNSNLRLTSFAFAQEQTRHRCEHVGGSLLTNIGVLPNETNLGPVFGDLRGSVAASILGQNSDGSFRLQHYYVTESGDTITLEVAVLTPTYPTADRSIVAVTWGNYRSDISGGTGRYKRATGYLDYFGLADFTQNTLVLRYRGEVCYAP